MTPASLAKALLALVAAPIILTAASPVRVLLVTGGHDHEASFYSIFEGRPDLKVNVNPHPVAFKGDLRKRYDVIVFYDMVTELPEDQKTNLQQFAESGKGIVALHHAVCNYPDWDWWRDLAGGRYIFHAQPGQPVSSFLHGVTMHVRPVAEHPITQGMTEIRLEDETYKNLWISPQAKVLLRTDEKSSDGPLAWISPYEKSRVVYIQLGHGRPAHQHPAYRDLVHRAILWTAGR